MDELFVGLCWYRVFFVYLLTNGCLVWFLMLILLESLDLLVNSFRKFTWLYHDKCNSAMFFSCLYFLDVALDASVVLPLFYLRTSP